MTMSSERVAKPDCDICGQPYHRHVESGVVGRICPVTVFSYRPKRAAIESLSITEGEELAERATDEISQWERAYPLSAFPEPDLKRAAEVLNAAGMTLDSISASNMRHVVSRLAPLIRELIAALSLPSTLRGEVLEEAVRAAENYECTYIGDARIGALSARRDILDAIRALKGKPTPVEGEGERA